MGYGDMVIIGIILFLIAGLGIIGYVFMDALMVGFNGRPGITADFQNGMMNSLGIFDSALPLALIILFVGSVGMAFMSGSNPILLVLAIILDTFLLVFGWVIQLFWGQFTENTMINAFLFHFPISNFVMSYFAVFSLIIILSTAFALYIRPAAHASVGAGL